MRAGSFRIIGDGARGPLAWVVFDGETDAKLQLARRVY
jgi:hypothetical protein